MPNNQVLIENAYDLAQKIRPKNVNLATTISNGVTYLLHYRSSLELATREDLLNVRGIGEGTVGYFLSVFRGDKIDEILKTIPSDGR